VQSRHTRRSKRRLLPSAGFSLLEAMIAIAILVTVSGVVVAGMLQMTKTQGTIANRTQMHSSVRNATEFLQQEIGQAGRVVLPPPGAGLCLGNFVQLTTPVVLTGAASSPTVCSTNGMYVGEQVVVDSGTNRETVTLTGVTAPNTITAVFANTHLTGAPVAVQGAFASGVVPPPGGIIYQNGVTATTDATTGSTGFVLKIYGDLNDDGNMVYVKYTCAPGTPAAPGTLTRNSTLISTGGPPVPANDVVLIDNLIANPNGTPCFTYQTKSVSVTYPDGTQVNQTFVINVAVTLTVQTQARDPQTGQLQSESKALLNVAPRNVFEAWQVGQIGGGSIRVQEMPPTVFTNFLNY